MSNLDKSIHHNQTPHLFVNNIFGENVDFEAAVFETYRYQYANNPVYRQWCNHMGAGPNPPSLVTIPFLPVSFFKSHRLITGEQPEEKIFESSGTTGLQTSRHYIADIGLYRQSFLQCFKLFYGDVKDWCIIGLLPAYLERTGSSLVMMADELVKASGHSQSGFYLYDFAALATVLQQLEAAKQPVFLIGVTFALLDFAEQFPMQLNYTTVVETGGMKGRKKEMIRNEVHAFLQERLGVKNVHSEYGMTELLSQAYSKVAGLFQCPPWMKVLVRDEEDPLAVATSGKGVLNIIDLANRNSCSFIAVEDAGIVHEDGSFEVMGRIDNSDIRGCSLLVI
jgi:phenylacetate-coenzyme A ligase PaaK-like adenylate-forming protein